MLGLMRKLQAKCGSLLLLTATPMQVHPVELWDLMDLLGSAASLPVGTDGAADDGAAEYVYRFAPLVGIYGGTLEVFRNMIAQYALGLGKPAYAPVA